MRRTLCALACVCACGCAASVPSVVLVPGQSLTIWMHVPRGLCEAPTVTVEHPSIVTVVQDESRPFVSYLLARREGVTAVRHACGPISSVDTVKVVRVR